MTTNHEHDDAWRPELLAGYADGELSPSDRAIVEAHLAAHPHAQAQLKVQKHFSPQNTALWHRGAPSPVSESEWSRVFNRIYQRIQPADKPSYRVPVRNNWKRMLVGMSALAAALLLAVALNYQPVDSSKTNPYVASNTIDAWPVALADDVDIISLQGDETMIVIGLPPLAGPLEMTTYGDVVLESIISDADGQPTKINIAGTDPHKPMWVDPTEKTHPVP
jgi:anti-sigma factor RsiW